ncbi:hypothetical protein [Stutzerimonas stutzeri]|uniref:Uncharacterized protein n=1 Tax=Stutzerimonas stutzeri (strain ATCC 17588 / DSM 5190 / CCUG 11256 / JCM 5965 / LMG 11199 / NBRC 14165 / NCIMB 11358 / Stanier 221) TaxID=96563 RepID=F8H2D7_STUS2|nr:hypothetical protein [Stutzerimonas stutzeri]AEJ06993.1 hypothetical protein PSTAB_3712 [Stutzerimonas stutzeri]MCQ4239785.1 hypothetical protein [Stutzerimonas stutzeri]MDH0213084.1 hypothetical protein [Stutzerimonas stutzeri]MDH0258298.1 hypothetical protein [Stutzerimonas stutzeri]MDH0502304.1 hypothetical protein [Stutzerimonas stutzeri]
MELLQSLLLTLAAAASAIQIGRARRRYGETDQPALFSAMLAFILAAASGATGLGGGLAEAQQWLERATLLLGLPLLALAALTLARRWVWSRPNWGRVVLGLCVFFELARQLGWSEPYALGLLLASALLVIYAAVLQWPDRLPSGAGVAAGVLLLLMLPIPSGSAIDNPLAGAEPLLLAIASPLLALLLLRLPGSTGEQQPTAT